MGVCCWFGKGRENAGPPERSQDNKKAPEAFPALFDSSLFSMPQGFFGASGAGAGAGGAVMGGAAGTCTAGEVADAGTSGFGAAGTGAAGTAGFGAGAGGAEIGAGGGGIKEGVPAGGTGCCIAGASPSLIVGLRPPSTEFSLRFGISGAAVGSAFGAGGASTSLVGRFAAIQSRRVLLSPSKATTPGNFEPASS